MWAAKNRQIQIVKYLAKLSNDINARNVYGDTALMMAVDGGDLDIVRFLIDQSGADVNATSKAGFTALMWAVEGASIDIVRYLLEEVGVDVKFRNQLGETAFQKAADRGYQEIQRILTPFLPMPPSVAGTATLPDDHSSSWNIPPREIELNFYHSSGNIGGEYRAKWLDADAVVKLYIPEASQSTFEDEVCLWQQLRHPNIVKMYGACYPSQSLQFFVCEYASNGSLFDYVHSTITKQLWRMCSYNPDKRVSLLSVVYELESLAISECPDKCQPEVEPGKSFEGYERRDDVEELWARIETFMVKCDDSQYCQLFNNIKQLYELLLSSNYRLTLLDSYLVLLTEFDKILRIPSDQAQILRLSSTRTTTNNLYPFRWRIQSLLASLGAASIGSDEKDHQYSENFEIFVSGAQDTFLVLHHLKSPEERAAFLWTLKSEMDDGTKHSRVQLEVMTSAYDDIASKIEIDDLSTIIPEWFIPWYELIIDEWSNLGTGGFGSVCQAKWLDSDVVVKQVLLIGDDKQFPDNSYSCLSASLNPLSAPLDEAKRDEALEMFRREVDIWFGLNHPHVVRLFGACHVGRPFFVCEYATNGTMIKYLQKHPDQLWRVLHEAALGVQYLHARGIVHGDLKGNNIVVGNDKKAKVTDFGLSSIAMSDDDKPQVSAALHWVAPECFLDTSAESYEQAKTGTTFASDIYSLGMCIVEALQVVENVAGKHTEVCLPWGYLDNIAVRYHARKGKLPSKPTKCTSEQWKLVSRMCVLEPQKRIKISTVVDELAKLVVDELAKFVEINEDMDPPTCTMTTLSGDLNSVPVITAQARVLLDRLVNDVNRCNVEYSLYSSLWNHLERVRGQIDDNYSAKCMTMYCSLVDAAYEATLNLQNAKDSLTCLTETTMRCYALERRLEKFCEVYFLSTNGSDS
ncbi:Serine/threonine protein kinase [Phytophthora megakarya]|uniref:Serine/threonine protein kinase n=1 Tax=Phytophthora megakarya TaxID=4795 RepID=A0A225VFP3_9STRA|nr:Serine/threonine protein kinase [Phytophthora megakarya]